MDGRWQRGFGIPDNIEDAQLAVGQRAALTDRHRAGRVTGWGVGTHGRQRLRRALILQRHFRWGCPAAVMGEPGLGLTPAPPGGPGEMEGLLRIRAEQDAQQTAYFRGGERDQIPDTPPFVVPPFVTARVTSRKAWASKPRVIWRCQPAQVRTSY
jgi:hypothetical protein